MKRYIVGVVSDQGYSAEQRYVTTTWQTDDVPDLIKKLIEAGYDLGGGPADDEGNADPEQVKETAEILLQEGYWDAGDGSYPLFIVDTHNIDDAPLPNEYTAPLEA